MGTAVALLIVVACSGTSQEPDVRPTEAAHPTATGTAPATSYPAARFDYAMAFDSDSGRAIMFGGFLSQQPRPVWTDETWSYDVAAHSWQLMRPSKSPSARHYPGMAYDANSDLVILFGGALPQGRLSGETWTYDVDADTWTEMRPPDSPSPRSSWAGMVYDPVGDRVILHGGWTGKEDGSDIWAYDVDLNAWTKLGDAGPRGSSLVYDALNRRILAFGGASAPGLRSADMWSFKLGPDVWEELPVEERPSPRSSPMQYAAAAGKIVLFGGSTTTGELGETWTYDASTSAWSQRHPDPAPSARHGFKLVYDPGSKALLLFGGGVGSRPLDDTWSYDTQKDQWVRLH